MSSFDIFNLCMCKKTDTVQKKDAKSPETRVHSEIEENVGHREILPAETNKSIRDSSDVKVRFTDSIEDLQKLTQNTTKEDAFCTNNLTTGSVASQKPSLRQSKSVNFEDDVKRANVAHGRNSGSLRRNVRESKKKSAIRTLHDSVRTKRVALRKTHAKLKIDLYEMQKMREILDSSKCAAAANLPDVITAESNCSEGEFMRKFRHLFDNAECEISTSTKELEVLTREYTALLAKTTQESELSEDATPSQVESESQRLANDSEKMLQMLKKAMKIAAVEYKLKLAVSDNANTNEQSLSDLELALLELQRLKSNEGLDFGREFSEGSDTPCYVSIRQTFSELFRQERILKLEKRSKLKLAELHIEGLENRQRQDEAKQQLRMAVESRIENDIRTALDNAKISGIPENDELFRQAENQIHHITDEAEKCLGSLKAAMESSSVKQIQKALKKVEGIKLPAAESLIAEAKTKIKELEEKDEKMKSYLADLSKAIKRKDADEIQKLLVDIRSIKLMAGNKIVEEATNLLMYLRKYSEEIKKDAMESARIRLVSSLESNNAQDIAEILLRSQMSGLNNNCVEVMGARTKLVQLQGDKEHYSSELKKIEDYLERLATRAADNKATVDLIMTLERAIAVAESLEVSPEVKQRARGALHILKTRKEKVKSVKDDLQRAVMECRHEAITCAIAEAESHPYFLTFDPLDGQIAAILEYAKNKLSPHDESSGTGETNTAVRRVKSNLKRSMRGNSSAKLKSAILLYRKTFNVNEAQEDNKSDSTENEETLNLLRRAERKHRRLKNQENLAESEWIRIRDTMRQNLKEAMKENDRAELWKAVYQFKRELGSNMEKDDETLLLNARKQLREVSIQQFKSNLTSALHDRDSTRLRHSLVEFESPALSTFPMNVAGKFKDDIDRAKKLLGHLKDMEKIRKSVAEMSRSQLAEIHRYPNPPTSVRAVMTATYILLGENEKDLKDWTAVLRLLTKMGRESLTRRVAICSPSHIPVATAQHVKEILSGLTHSHVQDVNKGAAVFFAWATCVVTEVFDRHKDDPTSGMPQKPTRPLEKPKQSPTDPLKSEFWNRLSRPRSSAASRSVRTVKLSARPTSAMK